MQNKFNDEEIKKLAENLLIGLSKEETEMLKNEFTYVEANMDLINNIPNLKDIEPMNYPFDLYLDIMSDDIAKDALSIGDVLLNCSNKEGREIKIPKVVDND